MLYGIIADAIIIIHLLFILLVVFGGLLSFWNIRWAYIHLPAVIWGTVLEFMGWVCPLTPLENHFRHAGGATGYEGGFVEHYLIPAIYPVGLTREIQYILGVLVIGLNLGIYAFVLKSWQTRKNWPSKHHL